MPVIAFQHLDAVPLSRAKELGRFRAPDCSFTSLVFTHDGKMLISGSADGAALVWDATAAPIPSSDNSNIIGIQ